MSGSTSKKCVRLLLRSVLFLARADLPTPLSFAQVANLRASLSHLTRHLQSTSAQLAESQSSLGQLERAHQREVERLGEELDGARALGAVWEARWRDEREQREALEARLGEWESLRGTATAGGGC